MIAAPKLNVGLAITNRGCFSVAQVVMKNIEVRVKLNESKMYPTVSGANFSNVSRLTVENCFFGLDKQVGWWTDAIGSKVKALMRNPTCTVGLQASND